MKACNKDCKHFMFIANTDESGSGICSYPSSFFPVEIGKDCPYEPKPYICKDCSHFIDDFACMTAEENDPACCGFVDKNEDKVYSILYDWKLRGIDVTEKL